MPTVVNELTIEPKASPPPDQTGKAGGEEPGGKAAAPETERRFDRAALRKRDRALRLWAH